ncbi:hypothetical protein [Undibacterium sp. TS12]|uniref:hypothetical protein n=1 Tax=Undibacterium sp. TS12 TaxID=2908202 RepID=UPI001F4CD176|nr:hypothetical protein [Undibacterium sp. TS12]MCH8622620.1 hypothetical protein [Undibacterium sp. TS12]
MQDANFYGTEDSPLLQKQVRNLSSFFKPGLSFDDFYVSQKPGQPGRLLNQYLGFSHPVLGVDFVDGREMPDLNIPSQYDVGVNKESSTRSSCSPYDSAELQRAGYKRNAAFFVAPEDRDGQMIQGISDGHNFEGDQACARSVLDLGTSIPKKSVGDYSASSLPSVMAYRPLPFHTRNILEMEEDHPNDSTARFVEFLR